MPVEGKSEVFGAVIIHYDSVQVAKGAYKVVKVLAPDVFDSKIIYDKCERDRAMFVAP